VDVDGMMKNNAHKKPWRRSWLMPVAVIALTIAVFGGAIFFARIKLRDALQEQIAGRDGEVLYAVTQMLQGNAAENGVAVSSLDEPAEQFNLLLMASRWRNVLATRLFNSKGRFVTAMPEDVTEAKLSDADLEKLRQLRPVCRYYPEVESSELFLLPNENEGRRIPLLEINVPLHASNSTRLAGVAQFLIAGDSIAHEFARLNRHLNQQAWLAFCLGAVILTTALGWAFRRLARQTEDLRKANQQLALVARTSAVGAVAAHLIHGLKNPLAGLQNFVANRPASGEEAPDWQHALASTQRMQALINEVVAVLREEQEGHAYEITPDEFLELVVSQIAPQAREKGVNLETELNAKTSMTNHSANLARLILLNLLQNAVQATPGGKRVRLSMVQEGEQLVAEVADEGPGLPEKVRENLFTPCSSPRPGGSGIGLAISKQLAHHLGASLELKSSTSSGCCFRLAFPLRRDSQLND